SGVTVGLTLWPLRSTSGRPTISTEPPISRIAAIACRVRGPARRTVTAPSRNTVGAITASCARTPLTSQRPTGAFAANGWPRSSALSPMLATHTPKAPNAMRATSSGLSGSAPSADPRCLIRISEYLDPLHPFGLQHTGAARSDDPSRVSVIDAERLPTEPQREQRERVACVFARHRGCRVETGLLEGHDPDIGSGPRSG